MLDTILTIVGNASGDAELRFLPNGTAVASFSVASTPRKFNKQTDTWEDAATLWIRVNAWRELAEGAGQDVRKGSKVIVTGKLKQTSYEAKDGSGKRTSYELDADDIGISVRAKREKAAATSNAGWGTTNDEAPF